MTQFEDSTLPEEGLRFFHGLANWLEKAKKEKPQLPSWKKGNRLLTRLSCYKPKQGTPLEVPEEYAINTLFLPTKSSGLYALQQIRHAFCHNNLTFDEETSQYRINLTDNVKIAGSFSLEAVRELVNVFLSPITKSKHQ